MADIVIIGGGGHAKVVLDSLLSEQQKIAGIFDETKSGSLFETPFINAIAFEQLKDVNIIIAIGDNAARKRVSATIKHTFAKTIHTSSIVARKVVIDEGAMILHGTILQPFVSIGKHVIANTGCRIDHDCIIGDYVHVAPGAVLCGNVHIGEGALIGAGSVIIPGVHIGKWAIIGAGSVVTKNIPDYAVAVGNPAKVIKVKESHD